MKLPRDLSGRELVHLLDRTFGYVRVHQGGSHMIVQIDQPVHHRIAVPEHATLRPGTLNALVRAIARVHGLSRAEVLSRLFD